MTKNPCRVSSNTLTNALQGRMFICCCYCPPIKTGFCDEFNTIIDLVKQFNNYQYMFILGDLSTDSKTNNNDKLIQLCLEDNLQYLINEPTRITATISCADFKVHNKEPRHNQLLQPVNGVRTAEDFFAPKDWL